MEQYKNIQLCLPQNLVWDLLCDNHRKLCHAWGQELLDLSKRRARKKFLARADECLSITLSWPVEARARAVKTWLSVYRIPLHPGELASFDQFHKTTGNFIVDCGRSLLAYE